ncbi:Aste57867_18134 [Aphanomyces stellatus]|uniref:Aste57867_18134 protein n=1 Tax=Aphanomyces stellatus TaxID=120398 RepID=A0A485L990_9STRA|nr:hypothetical protein As57867_018072 [Aphanomyces stellatus]VFT94872.1 Aste57867_18134 [Aphanomyces stellatus]
MAAPYLGVSSGELFFRSHYRPSSSSEPSTVGGSGDGAVLANLGAGMVDFLHQPLPSPDTFAIKRNHLRTQRVHWRRTRELQLAQLRAATATNTVAPAVETLSASPQPFLTEFAACRRVLDQVLLALLLRFFTSVEAEQQHVLTWQATDAALCAASEAQAKLTLHLRTFAVYLESETAGQVKLLPLNMHHHPQGIRCRRAAIDNTKTDAPRMKVVQVFKLEHSPLLERFQTLVGTLPGVKVKGLFCEIPPDAVERCIAFGMLPEDDATGIFKASWYSSPNERKYAQHVAHAAAPLEFPKRFSRYSSLRGPPASYIALCRVAMQHIAVVPSASPNHPFRFTDHADTVYIESEVRPTRPNHHALMDVGRQEEYIVRYPHYVVPEFLIQMEPMATTTDTPAASPPVLDDPLPELKLHGVFDQLPHPVAHPFEPAALPTVSKGLRKTKPELFGMASSTTNQLTTSQNAKSQWQLVRTTICHAVVQSMAQFWDRMTQTWRLLARPPDKPETHDTTTKATSNSIVKAKLKALVASPYVTR